MKKLNNKGFTLIELLAVIVIMGILMVAALYSVSKIIENSRKDTFANNAKTYIQAVRNAVLADNIKCSTGDGTVASSTTNGWYYFDIASSSHTTNAEIMEKDVKSPFGGAALKGYVVWQKTDNKETYYMKVVDSSENGFSTLNKESNISKAIVTKNTTNTYSGLTAPAKNDSYGSGDSDKINSDPIECYYS